MTKKSKVQSPKSKVQSPQAQTRFGAWKRTASDKIGYMGSNLKL
jgi:hypothetical protein